MVHYTHTHIIEAIFPYNNGQKDLGGYNNEIYDKNKQIPNKINVKPNLFLLRGFFPTKLVVLEKVTLSGDSVRYSSNLLGLTT